MLFLLGMVFTKGGFASVLENKYPSYAHVFSEFDVDEAYLYDASFIVFVNHYEASLKKFYTRSLERGKEVLPLMQGLLKEDSVSDLFIYLSMVESGFMSNAVSPKKAVGLWQFMPATAKHYNLSVCQGNDERCDTLSATSAALRYLNKLHKQFGKWYLAALAYNCGEGCVEKAIKRAHSDELSVLINEDAKYLPRETREYIKKILLVAMIGENTVYDMESLLEEELNYVEVEVHVQDTVAQIAKLIVMEGDVLQSLNVGLEDKSLAKKKDFYTLRIPLDKIFSFYLRYNIVKEAPKKESNKEIKDKSFIITHRVQMGESLKSLVKRYDSDLEEIKRANHLEDDFLTLHRLLVIPISKKSFENLYQ